VGIAAVQGATLAVKGGTLTWQPDGTARVDAGAGRVEVRCPEHTDVAVSTASGKVELAGVLGAVRIATLSGRVLVDRADQVELRTTSGRVHVGGCTGLCRVVTRSGKVEIEEADRAVVASTSGLVHAGLVTSADIRTVSGRVVVGCGERPEVRITTISGRVEVSVPAGAAPATVLSSRSGAISSECPPGSDGEVEIHTTSGAIRLTCR